jgi:hypothetical protein
VAIDAPVTDAFHDGVLSATFEKIGGPPGGGYGLIVSDQGPEPHDGAFQGGHFVVFEAGDQGTVGAWERDDDHWIDLLPWTPASAVQPGDASNDVEVRARGDDLRFLVNGVQVTEVTTLLPAGRVGVFVGGDGNHVALNHFRVEWSLAAPGLVTVPRPAVPTSAPTAVPEGTGALRAQLDDAWGHARWTEVLSLLDRLEAVAPNAVDFADKRYAAHLSAGQALLVQGNRAAAAEEFEKARSLDPRRQEAQDALVALTPTPTPVPQLPSAGKPLSVFVGATLDDIDDFWTTDFHKRGLKYSAAGRHWYSKPALSPCGPALPGVQGSFYCQVDAGLYLDSQFLQQVRTSAGEFAVGYAVAHEVGHRVQDLLGITKTNEYIRFGQPFSREIELQADCLAGVWSKSASTRGFAGADDVGQAVTLAWTIGDPKWASQHSPDAHGTPDDRSAAFLRGFNGSGPASCGLA